MQIYLCHLEEEERMRMGVLAKDVEEEGGAGRENHLKTHFKFVNLAHFTCFYFGVYNFHLIYTTLCASICWSPHARVTSKKSWFSRNSWNAELNLFSKSFHRRQNFSAGDIFRVFFNIVQGLFLWLLFSLTKPGHPP